jgi:hypothetical protein
MIASPQWALQPPFPGVGVALVTPPCLTRQPSFCLVDHTRERCRTTYTPCAMCQHKHQQFISSRPVDLAPPLGRTLSLPPAILKSCYGEATQHQPQVLTETMQHCCTPSLLRLTHGLDMMYPASLQLTISMVCLPHCSQTTFISLPATTTTWPGLSTVTFGNWIWISTQVSYPQLPLGFSRLRLGVSPSDL